MLLRQSTQRVASVTKNTLRPTTRRCYADKASPSTKTIFESEESAWDHVFKDVENMSSSRLLASSSRHRKDPTSRGRYTMTAREANAFDEMFNLIFNTYMKGTRPDSDQPESTAGVGANHSKFQDIAGKLRQQSKNVRWTSEADQELDRKKEEMDLCDTDQELLDWAMNEVFGESQRYEEAARQAMASPSTSAEKSVQLQPPSYPFLIASLMRTFRDKYGDPHLALSVFDHARHLSIASYVFGCTTPAYNELIETRWKCFRDVRGVCDALEEMRVNGIEMDNRTRGLAEQVRREVGERNLWEEEKAMGSGEVWDIIARIEKLTGRVTKGHLSKHNEGREQKKKWTSQSETWKHDAMEEDSMADWEFGKWDHNMLSPDSRHS